MSAEYLRKTAQMMRQVAEVATPGPWICYGDLLVWPSKQGPGANDPILATIGEAHDESAQHIASWHPTVALAVADWLDVVARRWPTGRSSVTRERAHALAVARAWRGDA